MDRIESVGIPEDAPPALRAIFRELWPFKCVSIYVHGSWADNTRTPFSDLDDLVIAPFATLNSLGRYKQFQRALDAVDMRFARIDPLQHHGHWVIERQSLEVLDESFIPLLVLEGALRVQGERHVTARIDHTASAQGLRRNLRMAVLEIERLLGRYIDGNINLYEMKRLVGSLLLAPAYIHQLHGERITKRAAIGRSGEYFSREALDVIKWATDVRRDWERALDSREYRAFRRLPYLFRNPRLYRRAANRLAPTFPAESFSHLNEGKVRRYVNDIASAIDVRPEL